MFLHSLRRILLAMAAALALAACASKEPPRTAAQLDPLPPIKMPEVPPAKRAQIHTDLGAGYYERGQMDVALEELNEAVKLDPNIAKTYNIYGLVYTMLREDAKAEQNFHRALALAPELAKHYRPEAGSDGPSWLTFIGHVKDSLWSVDLFRCELLLLRSHWVMVVMDVFTRRIIGFGVERADLCGASVCRMFNQIIAGRSPPRHLSSDHDPLFRFHRWRANLRILEVEEIKSIPHVPMSHPFVERLIGTIRREFLDHVFIWNIIDLERKLEEFKIYYNENRVHQSLYGSIPEERSGGPPPTHAVLDHYAWRHHCRGLFQMPIAA